MAVLQRHKSNIFGLVADLNSLQTSITAEATRASTAEGTLSSLNTTAKDNLVAAINEVVTTLGSQSSDLADDLAAEVTRATTAEGTLTTNLAAEVTRATTAEGTLTTNLAAEVTDRIAGDTALDLRLDVIESGLMAGVFWKASFDTVAAMESALSSTESTVTIGWAYYVKETNDGYVVIDENDGDYVPSSWTTKSLIKFADYTEVSGLVATERTRAEAAEGTLTTNLAAEVTRATTAEGTLTTNLAAEVTRAEAAEGTKLAIASNLSDIADVATARTNLSVYSKTEADALVAGGGAQFTTEIVTVADDKIVIANTPKDGVIFNFATVRHIDANFVSYDIPVTVTATAGGKEFLLSADSSGQFNGKSVIVQYAYSPAI